MAKKVIIYTRFSPRRNAEESESCETQKKLCEAYCKQHMYEIAGYFEDRALSGSDADRPGLWAAVEAVSKGMILVAYRPDRLARDVYLAECIRRAVIKQGGTVETVQGGVNGDKPEDTLIRQVLAAFSEYERKIIALRTKYAMLQHQRQGRRMSRFAPYGHQIDPGDPTRLILDELEQAAIQKVLQLHKDGLNNSAIAKRLDEMGYPARSGNWNHKAIKRIIDRYNGK